MLRNFKTYLVRLGFLCASVTFAQAAVAQSDQDSQHELRNIAKEAYIYAYSPTYAYEYLMDEVFNKKSVNYIGAFNKMRHYPHINTPEDTMITPAVDIFYSRSWLDLRKV